MFLVFQGTDGIPGQEGPKGDKGSKGEPVSLLSRNLSRNNNKNKQLATHRIKYEGWLYRKIVRADF